MTKIINAADEAGERRFEKFTRFIAQGLVEGHAAVMNETLRADIVDHQDYGPGFPPGRHGLKALTGALLQAIPDLQSEIEEIVFAGDESWSRIRSWGTFSGPYLGIPPTGKPISIYVCESVRWTDDDMIAEHWGVADRFGLLIEMGLIAPQYVPTWSPEVAGPRYAELMKLPT